MRRPLLAVGLQCNQNMNRNRYCLHQARELFAIRDGIQHNRHYKTLDKKACLNVRKLKINKRRKGGKQSRKQRKFKHQIQINRTVRSDLIKLNKGEHC